jgi:hypothetical protein
MTDLRKALAAPRASAAKSLEAAAWATVLRHAGRREDADAIERGDELAARILTPAVMRADQTVGTTTGSHWANDIVTSAVGDYFSTLAPISAGPRLIAAAQRVPLAPANSITFPTSNFAPSSPPWVKEGDPIAVTSATFGGATLGPEKKLAIAITFTRELAKRSDGRAVFNQMLREYAAHAIDQALFSADAASDAGHAGLRYGLTPIAGAGNVEDDVAGLLCEVARLGGSGQTALVCNPREAAIIAVRLPQLATPVWQTRALAAGTVLAIDVAAFASSVGEPEIFASEEAIVHMSDVPLEIVSGTGPTTADPVRSLFQTAAIGLRLLVDMAFVQRNSALAVMESVSW